MDFAEFREAIKRRLENLSRRVYSRSTGMADQTVNQDATDSNGQTQGRDLGRKVRTKNVFPNRKKMCQSSSKTASRRERSQKMNRKDFELGAKDIEGLWTLRWTKSSKKKKVSYIINFNLVLNFRKKC